MEKYFLIISNIPILVVALYSGWNLNKYEVPERELFWFILSSCIVQATGVLLWVYSINNLWLMHIFVPFGFFLLARFYRSILGEHLPEWWFVLLAFGVALLSLVNTVFVEDFLSFNSNALTLESIVIVVLSLTTFTAFVSTIPRDEKRSVQGLQWINSGVFIYYSSNLIFFYFGQWLASSTTIEEFRYSWLFHAFFIMVMYTCFFIGLWKAPKLPKS